MEAQVSIINPEHSIEEQVLEVTEDNWPVGPVARKLIFVKNSKNELCIHLRSKDKDFCPAYWDLCAGGCIQYQETDNENAKRELYEEYGIKDVHLEFICSHKYEDIANRCWGSVFLVHWDGEINIQLEEIDEYKWVSFTEIHGS